MIKADVIALERLVFEQEKKTAVESGGSRSRRVSEEERNQTKIYRREKNEQKERRQLLKALFE